eukprot:NODE_3643_length_534_cov_716.573196_g2887_i5.p1 GENE.NODE_3643_length_534_cov_716.573196_g2887_i5~~NODE_3643_length_534_cov_716.573196_g2887_i5.p1  ORF type:complete len:114 (-),score=8.17 NODE_3643_length_534_cov_716.573196_g2887_i5:42-383(-)
MVCMSLDVSSVKAPTQLASTSTDEEQSPKMNTNIPAFRFMVYTEGRVRKSPPPHPPTRTLQMLGYAPSLSFLIACCSMSLCRSCCFPGLTLCGCNPNQKMIPSGIMGQCVPFT